ncbi:endoglucanase precursor [Piromyces finnis]|uniref:cellulase n=1 Tax=Piromyces finnis TaxID=1754191 RepID=A0A1Y1UYQ7_9FUNG|nr:endoglucanase precursor [Piromyces finnis]|eukprot:ORX42983.1 endoglucanase precursor [Piromyces finnis]
MKRIHFIFAVGLTLSTGTYALRDISSTELVKDIKLGWNLGNTLDAECTNWLDYKYDQVASETCWGNVKTTENLFISLINKGFNLFRIPVTWKGHYGAAPGYKIDKDWLKRVHEIVDYPYQNGAYVIINTYFEDWINTYPTKLKKSKEISKKLWEQIAEEFKEYDEHLIFESMNSPRKINSHEEYGIGDDESWKFINEINKIFINTIRNGRGNNPKRHLLIQPYAGILHEETIDKLNIPDNDKKIMVSLHAFIPNDFTSGSKKSFTGTSDIDWTMKVIDNKLLSKSVATIISEFGATHHNDEDERLKWADYFISKATEKGIPCSLWDNGKFERGNDSFGIIDRSSFEIKYPDYVDVLLEGSYNSKDSTNEKVNDNVKKDENNNNNDFINGSILKAISILKQCLLSIL